MTDPINAAIAYEHDRQHAAQPSDYAGLPEQLRHSTELMANKCSVPMDLWQTHSNAVLKAADAIENLEANNKTLEIIIARNLDMVNRAEAAEAERDALKARVAELEGQLKMAREKIGRLT